MALEGVADFATDPVNPKGRGFALVRAADGMKEVDELALGCGDLIGCSRLERNAVQPPCCAQVTVVAQLDDVRRCVRAKGDVLCDVNLGAGQCF